METTMTKLSRRTRSRVKNMAEVKGQSVSAMIRELVEQALAQQGVEHAMVEIVQGQQKLSDRLAAIEARLDDLDEGRLNAIVVRARSALIAVDELAKHMLDGKHEKYAEWLAAVNRRVNEQPKKEEILRNQPAQSTAQIQSESTQSYHEYKNVRAAEDAAKLKKG